MANSHVDSSDDDVLYGEVEYGDGVSAMCSLCGVVASSRLWEEGRSEGEA